MNPIEEYLSTVLGGEGISVPDGFTEALVDIHNNAVNSALEGPNAVIAERDVAIGEMATAHETALADAAAKLQAVQAHNYQLLTGTPASTPSEDPTSAEDDLTAAPEENDPDEALRSLFGSDDETDNEKED